MKSLSIPAAALSLALIALTARAALIPVDGGRLVDDTANDTPCQWDTPAYSGHYSLTAGDFATGSGHLTWYGAQAFITYLNSIRYLGYADWRQPTTLASFKELLPTGTAPGDVTPASGELSELFYTELGARISNGAYLNSVNGYAALFRNLQDSYYYATEGTADPGTAGLFLFGFNVEHIKIGGNKDPAFAWPMRLGQASLKDLIDAVTAQVERTDRDGRDPPDAAGRQLQRGCEDLVHFLERESQSKDSLLDADVEAIVRVIGCR